MQLTERSVEPLYHSAMNMENAMSRPRRRSLAVPAPTPFLEIADIVIVAVAASLFLAASVFLLRIV
jgi:hypothetical protein